MVFWLFFCLFFGFVVVFVNFLLLFFVDFFGGGLFGFVFVCFLRMLNIEHRWFLVIWTTSAIMGPSATLVSRA